MTVNPNFAPVRPSRPLGTFFRWEIPSEGISVHLNLRIIELMERDSVQAGTKPVAGVLLGRPHRGRDLTIAIEHYEMVTIEGEAAASPFVDAKLTDAILDRWRPGRSRMSIVGLYRTNAPSASLNADDFGALNRLLPSAGAASSPKAAEYAARPTPISEDPDQIFLMIGPRTERISKATLYLVRQGAVVCESPEIPFDRTELAKIGAAGQPAPREPRPSATPEPRFSTKDIPNPNTPEPKTESKRASKPKFQLPGKDLEIPNWMWPVLAAPVLGLLIGGYFWNHGKPQGTAHLVSTSSEAGTTSVLGLKLDRSGSSWKLSWNENAAVVQGAVKGQLLITDGGLHRTLDLEASDLHGGTIIYTPVTDNVVLQLQVDSAGADMPVSETVRVVGGVLPPLETPQTGDSQSISEQSTPIPSPYPTQNIAPLNPPAQYRAYAPPASQLQQRNSIQTAQNFPPTKSLAPAAAASTANNRVTSQPASSSNPLVASEVPEPYRSLMRRGESMPAPPVSTPEPALNASEMPPAYRAMLQPRAVAPTSHAAPKTHEATASPAGKSAVRAAQPVYPAYPTNPPSALVPSRKQQIANAPERKTSSSGKAGEKAQLSARAVSPSAAPKSISPYASQTQTSPSGDTVIKLVGDTGDVETAELVSRQDPEYPAKAKASGIAGDVEVHFRIGKDGHVYDVTVVHGAPMLSDAAVQAVLKWRYKPARIGGVPSDSDANATFSFTQN